MLLAFLILFASVGALPVDTTGTKHAKVLAAGHHFLFEGPSVQDDGHINRRLRAREERGVIDQLVASTKKLWGKVKPDQQQKADKLFASLKTQKHTSDCFKNPLFQNWVGTVDKLLAARTKKFSQK